FTSRSGHTSAKRDWSSDVCASDLQRRVGTWDATATKRAMKRSGIARNVLTMADKVIPEIHGMQGPITNEQLQNIPELMDLITKTEQDTGVPVWMVTTSENTALILEKP